MRNNSFVIDRFGWVKFTDLDFVKDLTANLNSKHSSLSSTSKLKKRNKGIKKMFKAIRNHKAEMQVRTKSLVGHPNYWAPEYSSK